MGNYKYITVLLLAVSCSPKIVEHVVEKERVVYRDSTAYRDSTVYVPIPLESGLVIVSTADTARVETSVAWAEAYANEFGLQLRLENKANPIPYTIKILSRTIWVEITKENDQILTKTEFVEKPLSWWQSFKIGAFWWILGGLVITLLWIFRKYIKL